jgi:hypothetical protein
MPLRIQVGAKVIGFAAETKAEAFWCKKYSKGKEEGNAQDRAQLVIRSAGKVRSGPLKSTSRCMQESAQGREPDLGHQIEHRGSTTIRSGGRCTEFNLWEVVQERSHMDGERPS